MGSIAMDNWGGGYAVEVVRLPDVPVQCRPIRVGEDGLGQGRGGGGPLGRPSWFAIDRCAEMVAVQSLGGSPVWSGHIHIGSIRSMGDWR